MEAALKKQLMDWAAEYNDPVHFAEDPIAFPTEFVHRGASLQDIETAAVFAAHFAWGRRAMIVRDLERFFDFLEWRPADYVMSGSYRCDETSCHRTIKWSETALICQNLREFYSREKSLESLSNGQIRTQIYGRKEDPGAADKKINLMRRWMVRRDGKVDLGLWKNSSPASLIIPLDTHVHAQALALGLTARSSKNLATALEITESFREIFPNDPCLGDFALFGYGVTNQ